jgi:hypothetical protein
MDLFDPKPGMEKVRGQDLPDSIRKGQRLTTMTSRQKNFPVAPSIFNFKQYGQSGQWMSDVLPHLSKEADELCFIKSMHTEAINHDPAITFLPDRTSTCRPPKYGSLVELWFGNRK